MLSPWERLMDIGQTSRSTVKSELKSSFPSHCLRGTPRRPGASLAGVRGLQEGCPPGGQLLSVGCLERVVVGFWTGIVFMVLELPVGMSHRAGCD